MADEFYDIGGGMRGIRAKPTGAIGVAGAPSLPPRVGVAAAPPVKPPSPAAPQVPRDPDFDAKMSFLKGLPDVRQSAPQPQQLAPWAAEQVHAAGKNPADFRMIGDSLAGAGTSPIGVSSPANATSRPGVQSQVPGQQQSDPYRAALHDGFLKAQKFGRADLAHDYTNEILNYDMQKAKIASVDPSSAIGVLKGIMSDDQARTGYFAGKGVPDPGATPGASGKPLDTAGVGAALARPEYAALGGLLENPDLTMAERLGKAAQFEGMGDPAHPNHQIFQNFISQMNPQEWNDTTEVPLDPDSTFLGRNFPLMNRTYGVLGSAINTLDPTGLTGDTHTNTGFQWRKTRDERLRSLELLQQMGFLPPTGGRMPFKP